MYSCERAACRRRCVRVGVGKIDEKYSLPSPASSPPALKLRARARTRHWHGLNKASSLVRLNDPDRGRWQRARRIAARRSICIESAEHDRDLDIRRRALVVQAVTCHLLFGSRERLAPRADGASCSGQIILPSGRRCRKEVAGALRERRPRAVTRRWCSALGNKPNLESRRRRKVGAVTCSIAHAR